MSANDREPRVPWGTVAATAAAGLLLLSFFLARSGSVVAVTIALGLAGVVVGYALLQGMRRRRAASPATPVSAPRATPAARTPSPVREVQEVPISVEDTNEIERIARGLADLAVAEYQSPAAAVLVPSGARLTAAAGAGDWAVARQVAGEAAPSGAGPSSPPVSTAPEFPLDPRNDWLQRFLGVYTESIPMERWEELSDVPGPLLPLVGLAASGVGVAVPLAHRGRFVGLWILAQRPDKKTYSDAELARLERHAQDIAQTLSAALGRDRW